MYFCMLNSYCAVQQFLVGLDEFASIFLFFSMSPSFQYFLMSSPCARALWFVLACYVFVSPNQSDFVQLVFWVCLLGVHFRMMPYSKHKHPSIREELRCACCCIWHKYDSDRLRRSMKLQGGGETVTILTPSQQFGPLVLFTPRDWQHISSVVHLLQRGPRQRLSDQNMAYFSLHLPAVIMYWPTGRLKHSQYHILSWNCLHVKHVDQTCPSPTTEGCVVAVSRRGYPGEMWLVKWEASESPLPSVNHPTWLQLTRSGPVPCWVCRLDFSWLFWPSQRLQQLKDVPS